MPNIWIAILGKTASQAIAESHKEERRVYRMPFIESGARMNMKQVGVQQPQSEEGGWAFTANAFLSLFHPVW